MNVHIFITFVALLLPKTLELKLRAAGSGHIHRPRPRRAQSAVCNRAHLAGAGTGRAGQSVDAEVESVLSALGINLRNPILRVTRSAKA